MLRRLRASPTVGALPAARERAHQTAIRPAAGAAAQLRGLRLLQLAESGSIAKPRRRLHARGVQEARWAAARALVLGVSAAAAVSAAGHPPALRSALWRAARSPDHAQMLRFCLQHLGGSRRRMSSRSWSGSNSSRGHAHPAPRGSKETVGIFSVGRVISRTSGPRCHAEHHMDSCRGRPLRHLRLLRRTAAMEDLGSASSPSGRPQVIAHLSGGRQMWMAPRRHRWVARDRPSAQMLITGCRGQRTQAPMSIGRLKVCAAVAP